MSGPFNVPRIRRAAVCATLLVAATTGCGDSTARETSSTDPSQASNGGSDPGAGFRGPPANSVLPDFAAPSATGSVEGDANVFQRQASEPAAPPACEVRVEGVVNICQLRKKPVVLSFLFDRGNECYAQVDRIERVKNEFPEINFVAVLFSRRERSAIAELVRRRGWTVPIGIDTDGALVNLYKVGGCPTTVFAEAGGKVQGTELGGLTEPELRNRVRGLLRAAVQR